MKPGGLVLRAGDAIPPTERPFGDIVSVARLGFMQSHRAVLAANTAGGLSLGRHRSAVENSDSRLPRQPSAARIA